MLVIFTTISAARMQRLCCFSYQSHRGKHYVSEVVKMPLNGNEGVRERLWAAKAFIQDE